MKKLIAYVMLLSVVTHLFYSSGYLLDYYINTEAFKSRCINQDRPELHCDGKCILAQKIRAAQQRPDPDKVTIPASLEYLIAIFITDFLNPTSTFKPLCFFRVGVLRSYITHPFIPPKISGHWISSSVLQMGRLVR